MSPFLYVATISFYVLFSVSVSINVNVLILAARCAVTKNNVFQFVLGIKSAQIDGEIFRKMDLFKDNILNLPCGIVS